MRKMFPRGLCVTRTAINGFWQKMIPDEYVHEEVNEQLLSTYIRVQDKWVRAARANPEALINPNAFLIFEDCVDQNFRFNKTIEKLFYNGYLPYMVNVALV